MAKAEQLVVSLDPSAMHELKRIRVALEQLAPDTRRKLDAALAQADEEFHTGPVRIVEPMK